MYLNPYSDVNFFQFISVLFTRLWKVFIGNWELSLASDEIQLIVLSSIAVASALIGTFLVLQKMTMLANALSHTSLIGIALVYILFPLFYNVGILLLGAFIAGMLTTFLTDFLSKTTKLQEDASIGLVFTTLFASGILLITLFAKEAHIGTELVMGNADALRKEDIVLSGSILLSNLVFILLFFKELKISTFDPFLSSVLGTSPKLFRWVLMMLTAATTMCAFRAVGVLMVLAFLTGPPLIARMFTHTLAKLLFLASFIGIGSVVCAVALSRHILTVFAIPLSTGGLVVCIMVFLFIIAFLYKERRKIGYPFWSRSTLVGK